MEETKIEHDETKTAEPAQPSLNQVVLCVEKEKPFYLSKKYWAMLIGVLIPVANKALGVNLNTEELLPIVLPPLVYMIGQGIADKGK